MNIKVLGSVIVLIDLAVLSVNGILRHGIPVKVNNKYKGHQSGRPFDKIQGPQNIQKRGWGSILYYSSSILIRTTNVGLTLAAVVSDGCSYFPEICEDRDAIEDLDAQIQMLKTEYDEEYVKSAEDWVNLRDANNNNGYVNYYIDDAIQSVQSLGDLQDLLTDKLELKVPVLFELYNAQANMTSEDYLEILVGQYESNFENVKNLLAAQKTGEMIGLLVQFMVEKTLEKFANAYTTAYDEVKFWEKDTRELNAIWTRVFEASADDARILTDPTHADYESTLEKYGLKSSEITAYDKVKLTPEVLSKMYDNSKVYLADTYSNLREWTAIDTWDGFKEKTYRALESPISKMRTVTEFVFDANSRKYTVQNFELDWSTRIMYGLGALVDVITQAVSVAEWENVRDKMSESRALYEEYVADLQSEIDAIREEEENRTAVWDNIVETFTELSGAFDGLIQNASSYADFADVLGLPRLPVESNNPLLSVDLSSLDKTNLISTQEVYIDFLVENNNDLTVISDQMSARDTLYTSVLDRTEAGEIISEIQTDLESIYKFNPSSTVQEFGSSLTTKDVVCTAAILRVDLEEYDFYYLPTFRPSCDVSDASFEIMDDDAAALRNQGIMNSIVYDKIDDGSTSTISSLLSIVQAAYSVSDDDSFVTYGAALTERDIACSIATQFPDISMFDYVDLTAFRPDCDAVTESGYSTMKKDAEVLRTMDSDMGYILDHCGSIWFQCPCVSSLSSHYGVTDDDVIASMKRVKPSLTEYCSTVGCACVTL